jgi:hypothetical protein
LSAAPRWTIEALHRVRDLLDQMDDEAAGWIAEKLTEYLDPFAEGLTLDQALEIAPTPGSEGWRGVARRQARDEAIRSLAGLFPGSVLYRAEQVRAMLTRYQTSRWETRRSFSRNRACRIPHRDPDLASV